MKYFFLSLVLLTYSTQIYGQNTLDIPIEPAVWAFEADQASFVNHLGRPALRITDGGSDATGLQLVSIKDLIFKNGTIDYQIAFAPEARFTSIHFRRKDANNSEHFYLRKAWADQPNVHTGIQYAAILGGVNLWDLSHHYQSGAVFQKEGWNHVRLVVRDQQLLAYVNDMSTPALYVPELDGDWSSGTVSFDGSAWISKVSVTPDFTPGLSAGKGYDPTLNDPRYLRNWAVTEPQDFPFGREPIPSDFPIESTTWNKITAEHHGLVNLSRRFGQTPRGSRRIVWLKTTIKSDKPQRKRLDFGYSDEVYTFLNGQPLYQGKNLFNTPSMKEPRGRVALENSSFYLDLQAGDNELLIGVTNFFFGWGVMGRLDDGVGVGY